MAWWGALESVRPKMTAQSAGDLPGGERFYTSQLVDRQQFRERFEAWLDRIRNALLRNSLALGAPSGAERNAWALVGIKRRGAVLARRLWKRLERDVSPLLYGEIDISLYRDDYHLQSSKARVLGTEINFDVEGKRILLVDDVLYTGRTVRAAMDLILDFGRPKVILLAVFVDRGHRELPIAANFVGMEVATAQDDLVRVRLDELSESDCVELIRVAP